MRRDEVVRGARVWRAEQGRGVIVGQTDTGMPVVTWAASGATTPVCRTTLVALPAYRVFNQHAGYVAGTERDGSLVYTADPRFAALVSEPEYLHWVRERALDDETCQLTEVMSWATS